jgi:hypothetical protein
MSSSSRNIPVRDTDAGMRVGQVAASVMSSARVALAGATLASALFATKAHASNWDFEPRIELGGMYNDNYRLIQNGMPKVPAYGVLADVATGFSLIDQRSELDIVPRVHASFFPDDHEDQSTDGYFTINGDYRMQRGSFGGTANYSNETVLASELLPATFPGVTLGQVQGATTGRVIIHNRRQLEQVAPRGTWDFTPRWHLNLNGQYEHASFTNNLTGGLTAAQQQQYVQVGFQDAFASAGLQYDITQRQDIVFRVTGARFMPDKVTVLGSGPTATPVNSTTTDTNRYGVEAQWDTKPTNTMQTYMRLGVSEVHANTAVDGVINKTLVVGGAGVVWTYQLHQYVVDFIRSLSPSAAGAVVEDDELRFRALQALQPRLYAVFAARATRVRGASQTILGVQGSDYLTASAGLQYQLTRSFRIASEYDFTWQHFQGEPRAMSNGISVSVIWEPQSRFKPIPDYNKLPLDRPQ